MQPDQSPRRRRRGIVAGAVRTALVVGVVLCLINQGSVLRSSGLSIDLLPRLALNFVVPFMVAAYSRHASEREQRRML